MSLIGAGEGQSIPQISFAYSAIDLSLEKKPILAVFNMIPIPPLDGSRVVVGLLPSDLAEKYLKLERFGFIIIFGLLYLGLLDYIIGPIASALLKFLLG